MKKYIIISAVSFSLLIIFMILRVIPQPEYAAVEPQAMTAPPSGLWYTVVKIFKACKEIVSFISGVFGLVMALKKRSDS